MNINFNNLNPINSPSFREYLNAIIKDVEQYRDFDTIDIHISKFGANKYCGKIDINEHKLVDKD
jgi:hypothetical protein